LSARIEQSSSSRNTIRKRDRRNFGDKIGSLHKSHKNTSLSFYYRCSFSRGWGSTVTCPRACTPMPCWLTTDPLAEFNTAQEATLWMGPDQVLRRLASMSVGGEAKDQVTVLPRPLLNEAIDMTFSLTLISVLAFLALLALLSTTQL